jgi:dolichol-phosphate mannosyltransferase
MSLISIVIPCFNEEEVIYETHLRLEKFLITIDMDKEIIYVDDGSRDSTYEKLLQLAKMHHDIRIIRFSRNFGHQMAITAGMDYASGDAIVVIDADLQDPVEIISEMVDKWKNGFDVVYGKRVRREGESQFKRISAKIFYRILFKLTDEVIPKDIGDFRLIDRKVADSLKQMPEKTRYVRGLVAWLGYNSTSVDYVREPRFAGETKYPLVKMLKLAFDGIISFSYKPLKLASFLGSTVSVASFIYLVYIIFRKYYSNDSISGWTSLMAVLLVMSGMILLVLGIIGEYLARVYEEVKARPTYVINSIVGFSDNNFFDNHKK